MLVELYRLSRTGWPGVFTWKFAGVLRQFLRGYLQRKFGDRPRTLLAWGAAALAALSAVTRLGNPERWWKKRLTFSPQDSPVLRLPFPRFCRRQGSVPLPPLSVAPRKEGSYHSLFCALRLPENPAASAHEARELQILTNLRHIGTVEFFAQHNDLSDDHAEATAHLADAVHTPSRVAELRPDLVHPQSVRRPWRSRLVRLLRRLRLPVLGPRYPFEVTEQIPFLRGYCRMAIQEILQRNVPDFLFVSPQSNPLALLLATQGLATRLILIVHEIEAERLQLVAYGRRGIARLALKGEARRARRFEQENLARYDGVVFFSATHRQRLKDDYGYPPERMHTLAPGTDPGFRDWLGHIKSLPRHNGAPAAAKERPGRSAA
jgi:hypothetical protein